MFSFHKHFNQLFLSQQIITALIPSRASLIYEFHLSLYNFEVVDNLNIAHSVANKLVLINYIKRIAKVFFAPLR